MQRTEGVALAAGATVGLGGGMLGALVACTLGQAMAHRVLEQFSDQYIDLGPPALPAARPAGPASEQDLPHLPPVTVTVAGRSSVTMDPRHTPRAQRYRRYRILGLLPGLVMVGGGLYLGLAQQDWLVLVAGAAFLLLCAAMIATDRPAARRT